MSQLRALVLKAATNTQIRTDMLLVGTGISSDTGSSIPLILDASGSQIQINTNKDLVSLAGTGALDFSASSGAFKSSSGAVTLGPGAVDVSGAATFSAAGTALTVTNNASVGGTIGVTGAATLSSTLGVTGDITASAAVTVAGLVNANGGIDRSTSGALILGGGANTTGVSIGKNGATTTILGNLAVNGTETVTGGATFTSDATINGNTIIGDAVSDNLTVVASVNGDLHFLSDNDHLIDVRDSSASGNAPGGKLTIKAGAANSGNGLGGALTLVGGRAGTGAGGNVVIDGGSNGGAGTNGQVLIGTVSTSGITLGASGVTTTVPAGAVLDASVGQVNLPLSFKIDSVLTAPSVTAANLNTLTAGSGSDASALHTHSNITSSVLFAPGTLSTTALSAGDVGYVSATNTVAKTDSLAISSSRVVGIAGTSGTFILAGIATAKFTTDGGAPNPGDPVWLAASTDDSGAGAGKLTATAPTGGILAEVGICVDATGYAGSKTATVLVQVKSAITL
jgi:hypothetical protein